MKAGLATGEFMAASVGNEERMEYFVLGQAVTETMAAEGMTRRGGQLVVNAATAEALDGSFSLAGLKSGFWRVSAGEAGGGSDFEIKAETRRARGAIPWSAGPRALMAQTEVALRQVRALTPYLAPELVERIVVHARRRQVTSEFRPTTVLFCNFTGPEALLELWGQAGAQRVTGLLNAYFTAMHQVIARYGGIVSRVDPYSKGTKMLVLFGAPVAHEDDPQRAVSAALAMNAELEMLEESWRRRFGRHLPEDLGGPLIQHRIGITFGETFAGQVGSSTRREYTVMGDEVNLAARLMGAAEMGQVLVSQPVYNAVGDYFVLTALPPVRVKGKSRPVAVFQVDGPRDDTLASRVHSRDRLVGRGAEVARGEEILERLLEEGAGGGLTILGPAGIGKSHLADELLKRAAARGARVLFNQCRSYSAETAFACWSALLRSLAGITAIDYHPQALYGKLQNLMADLKLPAEHTPPLAALMGLSRSVLSPEASRQGGSGAEERTVEAKEADSFDLVKLGRIRRRGSSLDVLQQLEQKQLSEAGQSWYELSTRLSDRERNMLYEAVWAVLSGLANQAPVVIFFEDAHWMDAASRDLLRTFMRRIETIPVLFLMACRGDEMEGCGEMGHTLTLAPLDESGTTALVAHLLVADLAQVIHAQSRGNPLFVGEITRWFKRTRNLNADELRSVLQTSDILQKLILGGLETLPEAQREIARVAAVIGNEFRTGEVQALLEASIDAVTLSNHLRALMREGLIALAEAGADAR
ncbi:MAG: adenylate/guanylate cyclase domain-containing protein, partial [Deinococcota bacterium]